jgi:CRP/FNR family transcriptional regulator, cyclic AMP receptor protein
VIVPASPHTLGGSSTTVRRVGASESGGFLATLTEADRRALAGAGRERRYRRDQWLFHQADRGDFVVVLLEGRVKIVAGASGGGEAILSVRGPGELVGELAALDESPRLAGARALEPLVVRFITAEEFRALVASRPSLSLALLRMLVRRLQEADRRRAEFGSADAPYRVARLLIDLADADGFVALSQEELAAMAGTSRESVARALAALRVDGLVATERRQISVRDRAGLERFTS